MTGYSATAAFLRIPPNVYSDYGRRLPAHFQEIVIYSPRAANAARISQK